jgi:hypothetical protein
MSDGDNTSEESSEDSTPIVPWIPATQVFKQFGKPYADIQALVRRKKLRVKKINGRDVYNVEDLNNLPEETSEEESLSVADLLRAAKEAMQQSQKHHEIMFDKYMSSFDRLLNTANTSIDKQNEHILELEKQAMEMRDATEKVFNLEHTRKMEELKEQRTQVMQSKALDMVQKTIGPWIAERLGKMAPGIQPSGDAPDPRLAQLGQAVLGILSTMTDEQFEQLGKLIGADEYMALSMLRAQIKGAS